MEVVFAFFHQAGTGFLGMGVLEPGLVVPIFSGSGVLSVGEVEILAGMMTSGSAFCGGAVTAAGAASDFRFFPVSDAAVYGAPASCRHSSGALAFPVSSDSAAGVEIGC